MVAIAAMRSHVHGNSMALTPLGHESSALPLGALRLSIVDMMTLRVRNAGSGNPSPPKLLFQILPMSAMPLISSAPHGVSAVSIPQRDDSAHVYRIVRRLPSTVDGFVVAYALQSNRRYEALEVFFQGGVFGVSQFREIARRWTVDHLGMPTRVPGRYGYWAPTREQWGVILRDGGYAAVDPESLASGVTAEVREARMSPAAAGLIARAPIYRGARQAPDAGIPLFAQVEVSLAPYPGPDSVWIPFVEYLRARTLSSRPPAPVVSDFRDWLHQLASDSCLDAWVFRPGMFFGDQGEWWGSRNLRRTEHEGLDFAFGAKGAPGTVFQAMPEGAPVRALAAGEAVGVLDDFLGKTIVIRHPDMRDDHGATLHTMYSHLGAVEEAGVVSRRQFLGRVGRLRNPRVPAHLHLTCAWIPESIPPKDITMDVIHPAFMPVRLINLNSLVRGGGVEERRNSEE